MNNALFMACAVSVLMSIPVKAGLRGEYRVTDYGARGDGVALDTAAIQKALDDCGKAGGGKVVVPAGTYRSGTIWLRSHTELEIQTGATILGIEDFADHNADDAYAQNFCFTCEGWNAKHLVLAVEVDDVQLRNVRSVRKGRSMDAKVVRR